jgi:cytochrome c6
MKQTLKLTVLVIIILGGILAVWANNMPILTSFETPVMSESTVTAPKLYVSNCARCHGADGKGQTALGQSLDVPDLTTSNMGAARIKTIIVKGEGSMPAFGKKLKAKDITTLVNYVRAL